MSSQPNTTAPVLIVGDVVDITDVEADVNTRATVEGIDETGVVLRLSGLVTTAHGRFRIQHADGVNGRGFRAEITGRRGDHPLSLVLEVPTEWTPRDSRRSARVTTSRERLALRTPDGSRSDLVSLDVSASGIRATGQGAPLRAGSVIQVTRDAGSYDSQPRWVNATVTRVQQFVFGRYEVGLRFELETDAQRADAMAWRDQAARTHRDDSMAVGL